MEEKSLSQKESLDLIAQMINKAKGHYYESGSSALLWGISNIICFVLAYLVEAVKGFNLPFNPFILMVIPAVLQIYFHLKNKKENKTITYKDETHTYVWVTFGISIIILTIVGGIADIGYIVLPLLLLIFAMPTFISGCINKFWPLIIGGIVCWVGSCICFFYKGNGVYLIIAFGAFCAWVIPGIILRKRFYKNLANKNNGI